MLPATRTDRWRRDPRSGLLVLVAGAMLAGFVALAIATALAPAFIRFDMAASAWIRSIDLPGLAPAARVATNIGGFWSMTLLTALAAAVLYLRGRRTSALTLVLSVLSGTAFGAVLKVLVARVRPALDVARIPIPDTYSFPSGHALASVIFFGSVAFLIVIHEKRLYRAVIAFVTCALISLAISLSRVYLGVHFLGDVVGAWLLGIGWLALTVLVSARWGAGSQESEIRERGPDVA